MEKTKWVVDPMHSELGFKIKHLMISNVSGVFKDFKIEMETDAEDFSTAHIQLTAAINSVDTKNAQRDGHLLTSDFFEADKYPELKFVSTSVKPIGGDDYTVWGNLTMKGVTLPVELKVEYSGVTKDPWGGERAGFTVEGKIRRTEFGLTFNSILDSGGVGLGEDVRILAELQLVKQAVSVAA
ncbi:MAG: polyisoprenoid-binding protein [Chitinophagaceae bacterium]|nr:MAG: polyisoprenoid-binding protein [Chitinophagaceae bacterium]